MGLGAALVAAAILCYALLSGRLASTALTGPMLFTALGVVVGPEALDVVDLGLEAEGVRLTLEVTLAVVLFSDAATVDTARWRQEASLPVRLLGLGLPLTILLGWGVALLVFPDGLGVWGAALVAVILAPTDAALGQAVITNPEVPETVRQGLNVESGLNDGIAIPLFFIFLEAAVGEQDRIALPTVAADIAREVLIAAAIGVALGWAGTRALQAARDRGWVAHGWDAIGLLVLALLTYSVTDVAGGSGFIAAWIAGLVVGRLLGTDAAEVYRYPEETAHLLTQVSFFLFGMLAVGQVMGRLDWRSLVYAVLSLTVIRIVPVFLSVLGLGLRPPTIAYVGWFGPRGLASIILGLIVLAESDLAAAPTVVAVITVTVVTSIYAHGASAVVLADAYGTWYQTHLRRAPDMMESRAPSVTARVSRRILSRIADAGG